MGLRGITAGVAAAAIAVVAGHPGAVALPPTPVTERAVPLATEVRSYPAFTPTGASLPHVTWRVVPEASGNPYENYLETLGSGRILNWGGTYLRSSDDRGQTWREVAPLVPQVSAEGAIVATPDGGAAGVTWDPYSGDRVLAVRYDPAAGWRAQENVLHTPFFDRPWVGIVNGPVTLAGRTAPFAVIMAGGWPFKPRFISLDGLNYISLDPSHRAVSSAPFPAPAHETMNDWTTGHAAAGITPVPGGGAIVTRRLTGECRFTYLRADLTSRCMPSAGVPAGSLTVDSLGRSHVVDVVDDQIVYNLSADGVAWQTATIPLPGYGQEWDVAVHAGLQRAAVAVHVQRTAPARDQMMVVSLSLAGGMPVHTRTAYVGMGDADFGGGLGSTLPRFDFTSVAFLPDGKLVTSFVDTAHMDAAVAIEL